MSSQDTQSNSNGYILSDIEELVRAWKEDGNWDSLENGEKEFWSLLSNYSNEEIPDFVSNLSFHQVEGSTYSNDYGTVHLPSGTVVSCIISVIFFYLLYNFNRYTLIRVNLQYF